MNAKTLGQIWLADVTATEKLFLLAIADGTAGAGLAHPSVNYLVWKTGLARPTIIELLSKFKKQQILVDTGSCSEGGSKSYRLNISTLSYKGRWHSTDTSASTPATLGSGPVALASTPTADRDLNELPTLHVSTTRVDAIAAEKSGTTATLAEIGPRSSEFSRNDQQAFLKLEYPSLSPEVDKREQMLSTKSQHALVREHIQNRYLEAVGQSCPWDGRTGKILKQTLERLRWPDESLLRAIDNRFKSEGVILSEDPFRWIPRLDLYLSGPVNKFKQPTNASESGVRLRYGTVNRAEQRTRENLSALEEAKRRINNGGIDDRGRGNGRTVVCESTTNIRK